MSSLCKCKNYYTFFSKNISIYTIFMIKVLTILLNNDIVSFEQLGSDIFLISPRKHMLWVHTRSTSVWGPTGFCGEIRKILYGYPSYLELTNYSTIIAQNKGTFFFFFNGHTVCYRYAVASNKMYTFVEVYKIFMWIPLLSGPMCNVY